MKCRFRQFQRLAALVVKVLVVSRERTAGELHRNVRWHAFQQHGSAVVLKYIFLIARIGNGAANAVELQSHDVVLKYALIRIHPGMAIGQRPGLPAGDPAACQMQPGGRGQSYTGSVTHKVNAIEIKDAPVLLCHLHGAREGGAVSLSVCAADEIHRPIRQGQSTVIGHRRKVDVNNRIALNRPFDAVDE